MGGNQEVQHQEQGASSTQQRRSGGITAKSLLDLVDKQGRRCALSGRILTTDVAVVDHRMPLARGGQHCIENLQVIHADVNTAKGVMTDEEFVSMCIEVARYAGKT